MDTRNKYAVINKFLYKKFISIFSIGIVILLGGCSQAADSPSTNNTGDEDPPINCECESKPEIELQVFKKESDGSLNALDGFLNGGTLSIPRTPQESTIVIKIIGSDSEGILDVDYFYRIYDYCQGDDGNRRTFGSIAGVMQETPNQSNPPTSITGEIEVDINVIDIPSCKEGGMKYYHRVLEVTGVAKNICGQESRSAEWRWFFTD